MSGKIRIGLAGLGTVGATVAERLLQGAVPRAELVAVSARDAKKDRGVDLRAIDFVATPLDLASDDKVDVVVELIGGENGIALALAEASLEKCKPWSRRIRLCWPSTQRVYPTCQLVAMCRWPLRRRLRVVFRLSKPCAKVWPETIFTAFAAY